MISIIETAVVTIVVTVISGLLLDHYKNLGPRIVCKLGKCTPLKLYNRTYYAYVLTVGNTSKKTIHRLTINIQSLQNRLNFTNAKITRGLKFDSSIKNNILDVSIPYLSKSDKFLVTIYSENKLNAESKPNIIIRSPENFKEIDYMGQNEILSSLSNIPKNINKTFSKAKGKNSKPAINKTLIIAVTAVIVVAAFGVLGAAYSKMTSDTKPNKPKSVIEQPADANDSKVSKTPGNSNTKPSSKKSAKNTNASNKGSNQSTGSSSNKGNTQSTNGGASTGSTQSKDDSKNTNTGSNQSGSSGSNTTQNTSSEGSTTKDSTTSPSKSGSQNTTTTNSQPGTSNQNTNK